MRESFRPRLMPRSTGKMPEAYTEPELTLLQTVALLKMNPSTLSRGVARRLLSDADCQDAPNYADYLALAEHRYAEKPDGSQWHQITMLGAARAEAIVREKCRELKIHSFIGATGNARYTMHFRCTCGQWSDTLNRSPAAEGNAYNRFLRHVATAEGLGNLKAALKPVERESA